MCFSSTLLTFKYQCRRFKNKTNVSFASTPPLPAIPEGHFRLQRKPSIPYCTSTARMSFSAGYSSPRPHVTFKRCPSRIYHFIISLCVGVLYMYAWTQPTCLVPGAGGVREHWIPWDRRYRWCVCVAGAGRGTDANLSSSISKLDSLSESWRHSASLLSISLWSFRCSLRFSSLMCRSSSKYWAIFSESEKPQLAIKPPFVQSLPHLWNTPPPQRESGA